MEGSMKNGLQPAGASTGSEDVTLFASVEMGSTGWLVTSRASGQEKVRRTRVATGDWRGLLATLQRQRQAGRARRIVCCYEAGRDGFWLYRALKAAGIEAGVINPASIAVSRQGRRTKTDRKDGLLQLEASEAIDQGRVSAATLVVVPTEDEEDARQLSRTRARLVEERTAYLAMIGSQLARVGVVLPAANQPGWLEKLAGTSQWDGRPLPRNLRRDIGLSYERLQLVERQIAALEQEQRSAIISQEPETVRRQRKTQQAAQSWVAQASVAEQRMAEQAEQLCRLNGIGHIIAFVLAGELFWRDFKNRRQVGGYLGLGDAKYASGAQQRELGISKAGNTRARSMMVELAWLWVQHQPQSALARWFNARAPKGASAKRRRIAIVALARKLAVTLWRYLREGLVPEGALMKA
jgi:transposase